MQEDKERTKASTSSQSMDVGAEESPFGTVNATLGWETFRLVHSTWLTAIELPPRDENKWDMQVRLRSRQYLQLSCVITHQQPLPWGVSTYADTYHLCRMQHTCLTLLKEMLMTLDLAHQHGGPADRKAADRLQRR